MSPDPEVLDKVRQRAWSDSNVALRLNSTFRTGSSWTLSIVKLPRVLVTGNGSHTRHSVPCGTRRSGQSNGLLNIGAGCMGVLPVRPGEIRGDPGTMLWPADRSPSVDGGEFRTGETTPRSARGGGPAGTRPDITMGDAALLSSSLDLDFVVRWSESRSASSHQQSSRPTNMRETTNRSIGLHLAFFLKSWSMSMLWRPTWRATFKAVTFAVKLARSCGLEEPHQVAKPLAVAEATDSSAGVSASASTTTTESFC
mmetsp:Transcript_37709/g.82843  ORF Transcript_37709/g.82843 Transcript_37709/m.82843 type:complete len:255 (+) Transcript_37709:707-1471(+)